MRNTSKNRSAKAPRPRKAGDGAPKAFKKKFDNKQHKLVLYNSLPSMPDEFDTKFRTYSNILPTAATASILSTIFTNTLLHGADDMVPGLSQNPSSAAIGQNYAKYRVVSYRIDYTILPRSTTVDCNMSVFHSSNLASYASGTAWQALTATLDKSRTHIVPRSTSSPCVIEGTSGYPLMAIVGGPEYQQDDKYAGTVTNTGVFASPTDLTYAYFYTGNVTGTAFVASNSPSIHVLLTQYVKFYDKRY